MADVVVYIAGFSNKFMPDYISTGWYCICQFYHSELICFGINREPAFDNTIPDGGVALRHFLRLDWVKRKDLQYVVKSFYELPTFAKSFQKLTTFAKSCHKLTTFATCWKSLPTFAKVAIKLPKVVRHFLKLQTVIYYKNGAKLIKKWCKIY